VRVCGGPGGETARVYPETGWTNYIAPIMMNYQLIEAYCITIQTQMACWVLLNAINYGQRICDL